MGEKCIPLELLRGVSRYPVPRVALEGFAAARGLALEAPLEAPFEDRRFLLVRADTLWWLASAPVVAQGGQSYAFPEEARRAMRAEALRVYRRFQDPAGGGAPYGYRGEAL